MSKTHDMGVCEKIKVAEKHLADVDGHWIEGK
jgi:hypothetical protein